MSTQAPLPQDRQQTQKQAQQLRLAAIDLAEAGDLPQAIATMQRAITFAPEAPILRLQLGQMLERNEDADGATRAYYLAVMKARAKGLWFDESTVPAEILPQVLHAMQFVQDHRDELLRKLLEPSYQRFGKAELKRVTQALEIYLGNDLTKPANSQQRPLFLYVPGLTERPYLEAEQFTWTQKALSLQPAIAEEARAVLQRQEQLQPFLQAPPGSDLSSYLVGQSKNPAWDAYFFFRHGQAFPEHHAACPVTSAFLSELPRIVIPDHAPEICYSVLAPGSHILPHTGVTNSRVVAHLPLILPGQCALRVAGIERAWRMDEVLVFDDTFEHEAWNRSDQVRVILLMDVWHPDLSSAECQALSELVAGIGIFNRGSA